MKKNSEFKKFLELKEKYKNNQTKAQKEEVENEVKRLIGKGWATPFLKIVFDFGVEKYITIGLDSLSIGVYNRDKSVRILLKQTYGEFLPKGAVEFIRGKKLIFDPHKPISFSEDGIEYANLFVKNRFLSFNPEGRRIDFIDWSRYKNITPLFENVFKTEMRMNYFVNWLAYNFQTLSKARTAIISKGIQGTGKGVIFEKIIQYAIGKNYTTIVENEALKSRFNGELENKLFILANEIKSDFRKGNSTYEKLKMYVSDSEIRFEEKNVRARTIPNFFNIWFHSNNDVPLQIQGSDRRYIVFNTKSKKLTEVSQELNYEHISDYIKAIEIERDDFIYDIMSLKYDKYQATTPISTEEKELIYEASMSKIEVLTDKLKKNDIEYFRDVIEEFYQSEEFSVVSADLNILNLKNSIDFTDELHKQIRGNHIKNGIAKILYKIFVNENETERKIGLQFNKYLGKAEYKKIGKQAFKYRKLNSDKEVDFRDKILIDQAKTDSIIKDLLASGNLIIEEIEGEAKELF